LDGWNVVKSSSFWLHFYFTERKKSQGARSGEYGGWVTAGIFFVPKILEWKGWCEQEHYHGEETNHF
jgi:hypothetical protein